jgi:hypothetical protein
MKKKTVIISTILTLLLIALAWEWFVNKLREGKVGSAAGHIGVLISSYIEENGHFPQSEADLELKDFLNRMDNLGPFQISYGASLENFLLIDGKLYDKSSQKQVLLIDGPFKKSLRNIYESITAHWYELMLQEKQHADTSEGR